MKGLLVTYWFPPKNIIASHRTWSFFKYLNELGGEVDVICPQWSGHLDLSISKEPLFTHKIEDNIRYGEYKSSFRSFLIKSVLYKRFKYNLLRDLDPSQFYDHTVKKLEEIDLSRYDYIITSYNPLDSIHIGAYIKNKYPKIKWIIDYRDLFSIMEYFNLGLLKPYFKRFEKKITKDADYFITVSDILLKRQKKLLNKPGGLIYNGYDELRFEEDPNFLKDISSDLPILSYTGSFYGKERDIKPFLNKWNRDQLHKKYRLIIAVTGLDDYNHVTKVVQKLGPQNLMLLKDITYDQAQTLQSASAGLLMIANNSSRGNGFLTGKLFEYMNHEKPIIYCGYQKNYELYELIKSYGLGEHFEKFDFDQIEKYKYSKPEFFTRRHQAELLRTQIHGLFKN